MKNTNSHTTVWTQFKQPALSFSVNEGIANLETMGRSRVGTVGPDPTEKLQKYRFFCNTGRDPLKNQKATKPALMLGHHQPAREAPFQWRIVDGDDGPFIAVFVSSIPLSTKKSVIKFGPSLKKTF